MKEQEDRHFYLEFPTLLLLAFLFLVGYAVALKPSIFWGVLTGALGFVSIIFGVAAGLASDPKLAGERGLVAHLRRIAFEQRLQHAIRGKRLLMWAVGLAGSAIALSFGAGLLWGFNVIGEGAVGAVIVVAFILLVAGMAALVAALTRFVARLTGARDNDPRDADVYGIWVSASHPRAMLWYLRLCAGFGAAALIALVAGLLLSS